MIRISANLNGKRTVILGLDQINFSRLSLGEPILLNLKYLDPLGPDTGLPDIDIYIADTNTEDWKKFTESLGLQNG